MVSFALSRARLPVLRPDGRAHGQAKTSVKNGKYEDEMKNGNTDGGVRVSLQEINPCEWRADVTVPPSVVDAKLDATVAELKNTVSLPGFRPGKAPAALVAKRFEGDIQSQMIRNLHSLALEKIQEECPVDLVTLPLPEGAPPPPKRGADYSFALFFDAAPTIELPDYKKLNLPEPDMDGVDEDVEAEIARYREVYAEFKSVDDAKAAPGDMLKISFTSDVKPPKDAPESCAKLVAADNTWCWLNEPEMLPGIIKCLEGVTKGDKRNLDVTFPSDFVEPTLIGLTGKYEIEVFEIRRRMPVEDNGELCKKLGVNDIDDLKKRIASSAEAKRRSENRAKAVTEVFEALSKMVGDFPLPPSMLSQTTRSELRSIANEIVQTKDDVEAFQKDIDKHNAEARTRAESRLKTFFIARAIAKIEKISVEQSDLDNRIQMMSSFYGRKEKELRQHLEESGGMEEMHMDMTIEKVADRLLELNGFQEDEDKDKEKKDKEA